MQLKKKITIVFFENKKQTQIEKLNMKIIIINYNFGIKNKRMEFLGGKG